MGKLLDFLDLPKDRLACLDNGTEGSFHRKKNKTISWIDDLLTISEKRWLDAQFKIMSDTFRREKERRNGSFFTLPDDYKFY